MAEEEGTTSEERKNFVLEQRAGGAYEAPLRESTT